MMETGEILYEKVFASPRLPPKMSFKDNWMKELGSEVAGGSEDSQQIQPKSKTQLSSTERPVSEQPPGLLTKEIEKYVLFGCENTNERTGRPVSSCVPVSVERLGQDKDADENVDADHVRTGRPVESEQSIDLFTQRENFRVRELVKKIESHFHREAPQVDLQQNSVYNPFSNNSKAMIREMGNVELIELCETIPNVQCSQSLPSLLE